MNGWLFHFETAGLVEFISPSELRKKITGGESSRRSSRNYFAGHQASPLQRVRMSLMGVGTLGLARLGVVPLSSKMTKSATLATTSRP
jgi:hypothetical protein